MDKIKILEEVTPKINAVLETLNINAECDRIEYLHEKLKKFLLSKTETINLDKNAGECDDAIRSKLHLVVSYCIILFDLGKNFSFTIKNNINTGADAIARSFLECYGFTEHFIYFYAEDKNFEGLRKIILLKEMKEVFLMIKEFKKTNNKESVEDFVDKFNVYLKLHFSEETTFLDKLDIDTSFNNIFNRLEEKYSYYFKKYKSKNYIISTAIKRNKTINNIQKGGHKDANTIYRFLCLNSHHNYSSIIQRSRVGKEFCFNSINENNVVLVQIIRLCMENTYMCLEKILGKNES